MTAIAGAIPNREVKADARAQRHVSGWPTVIGVVSCQLLVMVLLRLIGRDVDPLPSLVYVSLACLVAIFATHIVFFRRDVGDGFLALAVAAFLLRLFVGVAHYLIVMNPDYSVRPFDTNYEWDYEWLNQEMQRVAFTWDTNGFLSRMDPTFYIANKNAFLTMYNGVLYWAAGIKVLNYAPWNALHSTYVAYIALMLARRTDLQSRSLGWIAVIAAFQPFGFISSLLWRDVVGHAGLALGLALMLLSRRSVVGLLITTPIAAFLFFCMREPYILLPFLMLAFFVAKDRLSWQMIAVMAGGVIVGALVGDLVIALAFRRFADRANVLTTLLSYPVRVVYGVLGPFPWYQITYSRDLVPGAPYMVPDFLQHVVNAAVYALTLPVVFAEWRRTRSIEPTYLFAILLFFMGLSGLAVHSSYVSIATVFMLPMLTKVPPRRIGPMLALSFAAFAVANLVWWASGLGGGPDRL